MPSDTYAPRARTDAAARLAAWAGRLQATSELNPGLVAGALENLLGEDCYWRDLLLLTWNIRTLQGQREVAADLAQRLAAVGPLRLCAGSSAPAEETRPLTPDDLEEIAEDGSCTGWLTVETAVARGLMRLTLRDDGAGDRASIVFTAMRELKGHEEALGRRRPLGHELQAAEPGARRGQIDGGRGDADPYVLVVGGGQSGMMIGARLKRLNVPALVVDKLPSAGEGWRRRYSNLHLHDPIWNCHLPYMPFPDHYPVYLSKDLFADWLDFYCQAMGVAFQGSTEVLSAKFDESTQAWVVELRKEGQQAPQVLRPKHLVLATGNSGLPNVPTLPGAEKFKGSVFHSAHFQGCGGDPAQVAGKRFVVVGSNTSAHDVAQDVFEHGGDVTMLQRSPTCTLKTERIRELTAMGGYSEEDAAAGRDAHRGDLCGAAVPYAMKVAPSQAWVKTVEERDADYYAALAKAGWLQTWGVDRSGPFKMFLRAFHGYYFDIGASQLVADGKIKLKSGVTIKDFREHSVVLSSGEELPCDTVVLATGYQNMSQFVSRLLSPEIAKAVGTCWGLGSGTPGDDGPWLGEQKNMWKPTAQKGLWFQGGNISMCRFHSLHLALQLKARYENIPGASVEDADGAVGGA